MNDLITNGETKTDEPYLPPLDRIENKLSYFIGKLVQHHVQKAVEAKFEAVVLVTDQLEGELDELKANQVSADTVSDLINERMDDLKYVNLDDVESHIISRGIDELMDRDEVRELITEINSERDAERNDAEDTSEYVRVEDLADGIRDCILNGEVTLNVEVS